MTNKIKTRLEKLYKKKFQYERTIEECCNLMDTIKDQEYFAKAFDCEYEYNKNDIDAIIKDIDKYNIKLNDINNEIDKLEISLKKDTLFIQDQRLERIKELKKINSRTPERDVLIRKHSSNQFGWYGVFSGLYKREVENCKGVLCDRYYTIDYTQAKKIYYKAFKGKMKTKSNFNLLKPMLNINSELSENMKHLSDNELNFIYGRNFFYGDRRSYKKLFHVQYDMH